MRLFQLPHALILILSLSAAIVEAMEETAAPTLNADAEPNNSAAVVGSGYSQLEESNMDSTLAPSFKLEELENDARQETVPPVHRLSPLSPSDILSSCAGALSIFGSLWILAEIIRDKKKHQMAYHRIVFGLSFFDLFSSYWYFTTEWLRDAGDPGPVCVSAGFFTFLGSLTVPMYNACLAIYFSLTVRYNWREERITREFEQYIHPVIGFVCLTICIVAIPLDIYNPSFSFCAPFNWSPPMRLDRDVFFAIACVVILTSSLLVTTLMVFLCLHVREVLRRTRRFSFQTHSMEIGNVPTRRVSNPEENNRRMRLSFLRKESSLLPNDKMVRKVRTMALLYTIPFYMCWVIPLLYHIILTLIYRGKIDHQPSEMAREIMEKYVAAVLPLQGFCNWFVYMFPRFQYIRLEHPDWRLCTVIGKVLSHMFEQKSNDSSTGDGELDGDDNGSMIGSVWHPVAQELRNEAVSEPDLEESEGAQQTLNVRD